MTQKSDDGELIAEMVQETGVNLGNPSSAMKYYLNQKMCLLLYLFALSHFQKNHTIVTFSRTMGGFEIFQIRTIVKSVLIETVL